MLEANKRWEQLAAELREENAQLWEELARRDAELERVNAELAVLRRLVFGWSERARPEAGWDQGGDGAVGRVLGQRESSRPRGPGVRAGRRDYSHLPRIKVVWGLPGGGYCCPQCEVPFTLLPLVEDLYEPRPSVTHARHSWLSLPSMCVVSASLTRLGGGSVRSVDKVFRSDT